MKMDNGNELRETQQSEISNIVNDNFARKVFSAKELHYIFNGVPSANVNVLANVVTSIS